jgi:hypothetical protein
MPAEEERASPWGSARLGWSIYQQIAAVLAAFTLAALLGQIFDIGWRGYLETLIAYWNDFVRPVVKSVLDTLIVEPLAWAFGWNVSVPMWSRDYLSVGLVLALSHIRSFRTAGASRRMYRQEHDLPDRSHEGWFGRNLGHALFYLFFWPMAFVLEFIFNGTALKDLLPELPAYARIQVKESVLTLSPLLYLGILFTVNYFLSMA